MYAYGCKRSDQFYSDRMTSAHKTGRQAGKREIDAALADMAADAAEERYQDQLFLEECDKYFGRDSYDDYKYWDMSESPRYNEVDLYDPDYDLYDGDYDY